MSLAVNDGGCAVVIGSNAHVGGELGFWCDFNQTNQVYFVYFFVVIFFPFSSFFCVVNCVAERKSKHREPGVSSAGRAKTPIELAP